MEHKKRMKTGKRIIAGILAVIMAVGGICIPAPYPSFGSEVWPQKSTAPFYCIDGGKSWRSSDRYEIYKYDTMPSSITETQAKRLFWSYPSNWQALKDAAQKYDAELYGMIAGVSSDPNTVKRVKDDAGTKFSLIADQPELEKRAIAALEKSAAENSSKGKEAPEAIREATSEEKAVAFTVLPFSAGPGALDTEFKLGKEFIKDIAGIEAQSVWDNGADGGNVGWLDASQDKNIAKSVLGSSLYEVTWSGDSIKIRNNGSVTANENAVGSTMSREQMYNKTTVRYKITMRNNSGWYTEGSWSADYLREWMDFKACVNAPGHQRLYKADIRIVPSDMVFYIVIGQDDTGETYPTPEYGSKRSDYGFQIYRHEEEFESTYNVRLKKIDDETGMPLKGSQFYLYERFEDEDQLGDESDGGLSEENLSFQPWSGFQIFADGTTDEKGEITHTDIRNYSYSKTYCDGHGMPEWVSVPEEDEDDDEDEEGGSDDSEAEEARDQNRAAARTWLDLFDACEAEGQKNDTHFHWLADESVYDVVCDALSSGEPDESGGSGGADKETAFVSSGCKKDCEKTYDAFLHLEFSYTWKEVQARNGYILHDVHPDDAAIEIVKTAASEADCGAVKISGSSKDIEENVWYSGNQNDRRRSSSGDRIEKGESVSLWNKSAESASNSESSDRKIVWSLKALGTWLKKVFHIETAETKETETKATESNATESNAIESYTSESDAVENFALWSETVDREGVKAVYEDDDEWGEASGDAFETYLSSAEKDGISHLKQQDSGIFSYPDGSGRDYWIVRDHRTEGKIDINKRDMDLYKGESDDYSSFGDTEGDGVLEGAVYGLFAAEDIRHPDSDMKADGSMTNTGVVYRKNDLVSVAVTDSEGNAGFSVYTVRPGMTYDYELREIVKRKDIDWNGPENLYKENQEQYGNWWIKRPLILGNYYVKELSRSLGYELSVNGRSKEWTNYGSETKTPESIVDSNGMAVISIPELSATMEGEDESGNGYDQFTFTVTSSGTTDQENESDGYEILITGFPENTEFYRVDSGVREVTGPHVTGTKEEILRDDAGNIIWKTAESDTSHVCYEPEYDENGVLTGQSVVSRTELQTLTATQVPQALEMQLKNLETELSEDVLHETLTSENFGVLKAEVERILNRNGYEIPVMFDGSCSLSDAPVYSIGVRKGEEDQYGMTVNPGEKAVKTVYGAAIQTIVIEDADEDTTIEEFLQSILAWYKENPVWSFGGVHQIQDTENGCEVSLYAGASVSGSRRFFTMQKNTGKAEADAVYTVVENPALLRWEYQKYDNTGIYQYQILKQYAFGSGSQKRYYMDVELMPAVMAAQDGTLQMIQHTVMVYHKQGEEIIDYLNGDPDHGYRVPQTEITDKIEITTELENVEEDIRIAEVSYDKKTGVHRIKVRSNGTDAFGKRFSDEEQSLTLTFMAKFPEKKAVISEADLVQMGAGNVYGYRVGDSIGFAEYLMRFKDVSISAGAGLGKELSDTYIVKKQLFYRGQSRVTEDGNTTETPVQVLQRPVKQKVQVIKKTEDGEVVGNFRFKIYLKSNLERLYCDPDGNIEWQDRYGNVTDIKEYKENFPELVQKIYTRKTERRLLENENYEKFFDAVQTANTDVWKNEGKIWNTSWKPFVKNLFTGVENKINSSADAKENAGRSDAVRQFAIKWYLKEEIQNKVTEETEAGGYLSKEGNVTYQDEIYDQALYQAILKAEIYLKPFFKYDLDSVYAVLWDSEADGGIDGDMSTLSADQLEAAGGDLGYAYGISKYLPYGKYVLTEQQPYRAEWFDFENRHYKIDTPKEIELPIYYEKEEKIPYGDVEWSVTEPDSKTEMSGYASQEMFNERYRTKIRIEKADAETGEPILHDDAVFALYKAERNEEKDGDGAVKRYEKDTVISGSRQFLEAMGAENITPFARNTGKLYFGLVKAGTPICNEEDAVILNDPDGRIKGQVLGLSAVKDHLEQGIFQTVGYTETPEPVEAGVYVLAELKPPSGYARSKPIAAEVYSDAVRYDLDGGTEKAAAVRFDDEGEESVRLYVHDTAVSLEVSKVKTMDRYRGMKVSGRVEGTISELHMLYGLENLELAYNSMGTYLGFGWKKGTLELLEERKAHGERVELVYENGVFQGYGYVTRTLETADDENRYIAGAELALYDAIEVRRSGDSADYAFEGVKVVRDRNGNVKNITVEEGYAGEKTEFIQSEEGFWTAETIKRKETPVLFYDLGNLKVLKKENGTLYGYDKNSEKIKITSDTESVFAIRGGRAEFEIVSQDFSELIYSKEAKAFTKWSEDTEIYHLDQNLCRDSLTDPYTGLAYIEKIEKNVKGKEEKRAYLWPVTEIRDSEGNLAAKEKILTGRIGEKNEGTENAYLTGTWNPEKEDFEKRMNPVYDKFGMVQYYLPDSGIYQKGKLFYDRDGDILSYQYDDLLEMYNRAAYQLLDHDVLYENEENGDPEKSLRHRQGESWIIPNVWISGKIAQQDVKADEMSLGQADILRRIIPGTYIMEEKSAPAGYVRALPVAVKAEETADLQRVSMADEKIKVEIIKADGTDQYKKAVITDGKQTENETEIEGKGAYTGSFVVGARLALYKADRIYVSDYEKFPKGYYLVKAESTPASWTTENPVDNSPVTVEAMWITDHSPKYFEGIPAGDYILEEIETPSGYLGESMEVTIKETEMLQTFLMWDDHTKVEILKYETDQNGVKQLLPAESEAELTLYPAVIGSNGEPIVKDGQIQYEEEFPVDTWTTSDRSHENEKIKTAYEEMYEEYGASFKQFSWEIYDDGAVRTKTAVLKENRRTANEESSIQIWEKEDGTQIQIAASRNDGTAGTDHLGRRNLVFTYCFHYKESENEKYPYMISYDTENGIHRIDYLPIGVYVLVETKVPDGYRRAEPCVIRVGETDSIQRFTMENEKESEQIPKGRLIIEKKDADHIEKNLSGAWFEVENLSTGKCLQKGTDESGTAVFSELPIEGRDKEGKWGRYVYKLREITAPAGYCLEKLEKIFKFNGADEESLTYHLTVSDHETKVSIQKIDSVTKEELSGAKLVLKDKDGMVIDQWITGKMPHEINGVLVAGETYILYEEEAPDGYLLAEPIEFTVAGEGTAEWIIMEDLRADVPDTPKEPEKPEEPEPEPEIPEEPEQPEKPDRPDKTEKPKPEPEPEILDRKYGYITAEYPIPLLMEHAIYLDDVKKEDRISAPKTGEDTPIELICMLCVISFAGMIGMYFASRYADKNGKEKRENHN